MNISTDESGYRGNARVGDIQQIVARYYAISKADLVSRQRRRAISGPRQIAMYLCRELTTRSLPDIGRRFGKDHTTVLHAIRAVEARWQALAGDIAALREQIIHFAELRELDALSGPVYLAAEAQYEWPDAPEPEAPKPTRRIKPRASLAPVPPEAWIPGHPIPSAFPDCAPCGARQICYAEGCTNPPASGKFCTKHEPASIPAAQLKRMMAGRA